MYVRENKTEEEGYERETNREFYKLFGEQDFVLESKNKKT